MARKSNAEKEREIQEAATTAEAAVRAPALPSSDAVENLDFEALWELHEAICSKEPPECKRTFHPRDFRAHVLLLVSAKQKRIA